VFFSQIWSWKLGCMWQWVAYRLLPLKNMDIYQMAWQDSRPSWRCVGHCSQSLRRQNVFNKNICQWMCIMLYSYSGTKNSIDFWMKCWISIEVDYHCQLYSLFEYTERKRKAAGYFYQMKKRRKEANKNAKRILKKKNKQTCLSRGNKAY